MDYYKWLEEMGIEEDTDETYDAWLDTLTPQQRKEV